MSATFYQASVPVFIRSLNNLGAFFDKAVAHAQAANYDPEILLNSRLYPDMHPFWRQVRIATDTATGVAARLAGQTPPALGHEDVSVEATKARINAAVEFLNTLQAGQLEGADAKTIEVVRHDKTTTWIGRDYLFNYGLPNVFFHVTTAYAILRHNGVPLGKRDFLGN